MQLFKAQSASVPVTRGGFPLAASHAGLRQGRHCPTQAAHAGFRRISLTTRDLQQDEGICTGTFRNDPGSQSRRAAYPDWLRVVADAKYQKSR